MSQDFAPNAPRNNVQFVDLRTGFLTAAGHELLQQIWRQVAAGFTLTPCTAEGTNDITLTPILHAEGGRTVADYMPFAFEMPSDLSGDMQLRIVSGDYRKAYTDFGQTQATTGNFLTGDFLIAFFVQSLDSAVGGYVLK